MLLPNTDDNASIHMNDQATTAAAFLIASLIRQLTLEFLSVGSINESFEIINQVLNWDDDQYCHQTFW